MGIVQNEIENKGYYIIKEGLLGKRQHRQPDRSWQKY